jgi:thioredoxin-dependent peroxiredoxin
VKLLALVSCFSWCFSWSAFAADLKVGDQAPTFQVKTDEGKDFDLEKRKDTWTILYFYPKAETPGCTKQACAFSDNVEKLRKLGADVFGVSSDGVDALKKFKDNHKLKFTLLADPELKAINSYGTKMPVVSISKRWTFIIGPDLKIAAIDREVDPVKDWERVASKLQELKPKTKK